MARPRAESLSTATPERIVGAAIVRFANEGRAARLADIASDAGIRRPSLLHHFPSKDALYATVVQRTFADLAQVLAAEMQRDLPFDARLVQLACAYGDYLAAHPQRARILVLELVQHGGPGHALMLEHMVPTVDGVLAFLQDAGQGWLREALPLRAAVMQVAADLTLRHAAGLVGDAVWGEGSAALTEQLVRTQFLRETP